MGNVKILDERLEKQRARKEAAFRATTLDERQRKLIGEDVTARATAIFDLEGEATTVSRCNSHIERRWLIRSIVVFSGRTVPAKKAIRIYEQEDESCQVTLVQADDGTVEMAINDVGVEAYSDFSFTGGSEANFRGLGGGAGNRIGLMFDPRYEDAEAVDQLFSLFDGQIHDYVNVVTTNSDLATI